jgi:hypothetical protein
MDQRLITFGTRPLKQASGPQKRLIFLKLTITLLLLASIPYLYWVTNYFVADDWPVLARSESAILSEIPQQFLGTQFGWYRPLFDLYMVISWKLFGMNPLGYHLMSILLYAFVSVAVGYLGWLLTDDVNVSLLAVIIFALHNCHSEVVMWISSANELLAGFFTLSSIIFYLLYRRRHQFFWFLLAIVGGLLAITSKETALFIPIAFLVYDILFYSTVSRKKLTARVLIPAIVLLVLIIIHISLRPPAKASTITVDILHLIKNLIYYLTMQLLTIPVKFTDVLILPWSLPTLFLTLISLIMVGAISLSYYQIWLADKTRLLALTFSVAFTLISLIPVIFVIWERTTFISSMGIALTLSLLFTSAWNYSAGRQAMQKLIMVAFILWISTNTLTLIRRNYWWGQAGTANKIVVDQLGDYLNELPAGAQVCLVNLPDHFENAFAFRNSFPKAAELLGYQQVIYPILDTELESLSSKENEAYNSLKSDAQPTLVLVYENGSLTLPVAADLPVE